MVVNNTTPVNEINEKASTEAGKFTRAIEAGVIWNSQYQDIKDRLGYMLYRAAQALLWPATRPDSVDQRLKETYAPSNLHDLRSYSKKIEALRSKGVAIPAPIDEFLSFWLPILSIHDNVKPLVKKGRKPSENPSKTPPRTLEYTGTCPVCGRNFKLELNDRIVLHGYEVTDGSFNGRCFGVGYPCIEDSSEGLEAYLKALKQNLDSTTTQISKIGDDSEFWYEARKFVKKGDEYWEVAKALRIHELTFRKSSLESSVRYTEARLVQWVKMVRPGILAGFSK